MEAMAAALSFQTTEFWEGNQVFSATNQEFIADSSLMTMMATGT
jgi:hypothetical protein